MNSMKRERDADVCCVDSNRYGYGLQINLDDDQCETLGLDKPLRVGTQVGIQAIGIVTRSGECLESDGRGVSLSIQITDLGLAPQGKASDAAAKLYGDD